ncbi:MAG: metallophosphoesterase family protein [Elusimicrobia bacterium]|nr:metallophosphoesterase family protein [Elusimicrobiota bacterium]
MSDLFVGPIMAIGFICLVGLVFYLEARWIVLRVLSRGRGEARPWWDGFWPSRSPRTAKVLTALLNGVAFVGLLCVLWGWLVEPRWIEVTEVVLESPKVKPETGRIRVVQISDFHSEAKPLNELKAAEIVNSLQPDLVVFTGDYINSPEGLKIAKEAFRAFKPGHGTFLVSGNYDLGMVPEDAFKDLSVVVLENGTREVVIRGTKVRVLGMALEEAPGFKMSMSLLRTGPAYDIFLFHYADLIGQAAELGVDLYLAGHTHGGQVRLPFYGALVTLAATGKKYESGLYRVGPTTLYVNRGLGMEGGLAPRVRFLCRPEITVIDVFPAGMAQGIGTRQR